MPITFQSPHFTGKELYYVNDAMQRGPISGDGYYTQMVRAFIEERFGIDRVLLTTSATHALEMAAMMIGLKPGDEVIMPSFSFPSTANAVMLRGAKPVFADIDDSLNIDPDDIAAKITEMTKAILPVHYAGIGCRMDEIMDLASRYGLYVIEDAAQAINAKYKSKYLGTLGHIGCYSFHGTKNVTCGEGGALLLNGTNPQWWEMAEIISQKGTNRNRFVRGEVDKYSWVGLGSSYIPSDILMAFLYAQLLEVDLITARRQQIFERYANSLSQYSASGRLRTILPPRDCTPNYHLFYVLLNDEKDRESVRLKLNRRGVNAVTHFVPLHSSPMGRELGCSQELPKTDHVAQTLLRLPLHTQMTDFDVEYVIHSLSEILNGNGEMYGTLDIGSDTRL